ncbi:hypothetical protein M758_4G141500 [Ceratodon purpureus]|nr:hypothetical protein M758_4G141500 [Ceratodon purpureus]
MQACTDGVRVFRKFSTLIVTSMYAVKHPKMTTLEDATKPNFIEEPGFVKWASSMKFAFTASVVAIRHNSQREAASVTSIVSATEVRRLTIICSRDQERLTSDSCCSNFDCSISPILFCMLLGY